MSFREFLKLAVAALLIALAAALHSPYAQFAASPSAGWASTSTHQPLRQACVGRLDRCP